MFSTRSANDVFAAKFTDPLRAVLAGNISDSGPVFETVGRLWSAAEIALEQLPEAEAHKSTEGAPLADDVKDAVSATTEALWRAVEPKVRPASGEPFTSTFRPHGSSRAFSTAGAMPPKKAGPSSIPVHESEVMAEMQGVVDRCKAAAGYVFSNSELERILFQLELFSNFFYFFLTLENHF